MKEKRAKKIFMVNTTIKCGWMNLNINNDIIIPVSYLNTRFFYDLLSVVQILNNYNNIGCKNLCLEIDCEGTFAYINFSFFQEKDIGTIIEYDDLEYVYVSIEKELLGENDKNLYTQKKSYSIKKRDLIENIISFIENKTIEYNTDFCCDDIADKIYPSYIKNIKDNLIDKLKF